MKLWKKLTGVAVLAVSLLAGSILQVSAEEETSQVENSWRYENGVPIEQEEPNEGIMVTDYFTTLLGIDVSEHQGVIDWEKVKASGIDYAILRVGYGKDRPWQDDKQWERNVSECERLGIPYGVYIYSYANTVDEAADEANHVLRLINGRKLAYPVYFDMEDSSTLKADHAKVAEAFCTKIEAAGFEAGVYSNLNWWNNYLTDPVFSNWERWVAQYNVTCDYKGSYGMWQYTSKGRVDGIQGNVDMNYVIEKDGNDNGFISPTRFQDVEHGAWYYNAVSYVANNYIMTGKEDTVFAPAENLARAQLATVLYRMAGSPAATFENRFPDVGQNEYYTDAVMWASSDAVNVVTGYTDTGKFAPSNDITREELVTMLYRYAQYQKKDVSQKADISSFPDAGAVNEFAKEAMQWAVAKGLITGDNGCINPQGNANRAECAMIIMRYMKNI